MEYLKSDFVEIKKEYAGEVPMYVVTPKLNVEKHKTIFFYHGWSSNALSQIFRANILASYGYQVILPEARFHGERGELDYDLEEVTRAHMMQVIMHNIEEFPSIYKYSVENLNVDEENVAVSGHSMGAITAGGLFTFKTSLKTAVLFNGTMNWEHIVDALMEGEDEISYERMRINEFMIQMNPQIHLEDLKDRALGLFNGAEDDVMPPISQEEFYEKAVEKYGDKELIKFEKFDRTYHQLTTQMLESSIIFLKEVAKF
ncbi:prolyl oligopeptidase family serine peptidase [Anaerosphaera multitolerans]|uniref:Phospholipase n=1 Tax=Anaerosphaera multitolerans TaxID=2487351 RepID=A0A437S9K6_9FIRM|nr:prolyl oligopeptidase family serine peptidase [Anaerosphaera multitolerans]RVU55524.1 phospholipase [Anaerosphaera multitolerans]